MDPSIDNNVRYRIGDLVLDPGRRQVERNGEILKIPGLSFRLLLELARAAPNVLTHSELIDQVWSGRVVSPETITQRVKLLREALGDDASAPRYIGLVRGDGYRLVPDVALLPAGDLVPELTPRRWSSRVAVVALAMLVVVLAAVRFWPAGAPPADTADEFFDDAVISPNAIAVLPFVNASKNPDDSYISEGLGDALRDQLGRIAGLSVAARASSVAVRNQSLDALTAARRLGVGLIVEGTLRGQDDQLLITVQLIDAEKGFQIWTRKYDAEVGGLLNAQQQIAADVAQHVLPTLDADVILAGAATLNVTANEAMLLARAEEQRVRDRHLVDVSSMLRAIEWYRVATTADPESAIAHSRLGGALLHLGDVRSAENPILKAQAINPDLADVQYNLGLYLWLREQSGSGAAYERAIELNPKHADALAAYGKWIWHQDESGAAGEYFQRALAVDRLSLLRHADLGNYYGIVGRRDEALEIAKKIEREFDGPDALMILARIYETTGDIDVAIARALSAHAAQPDDPEPGWMVAELYARINDFESASRYEPEPGVGQLFFQRRYDELIELGEELVFEYPNEVQTYYALARAYNATGQFDRTIKMLENFDLVRRVRVDSRRANAKEALTSLADAYDAVGETDKAQEIAQWVAEMMHKNGATGAQAGWWSYLYEACSLSVLDRDDEAMESLEQIKKSPGLPWYPVLVDSPCFTRFADDPRYIGVVDAIDARIAEIQARVAETIRQAASAPEVPAVQLHTNTR